MIDSEDIRDKKSNSLIDEFDRLEQKSSAEVDALLQDEDNAAQARAILRYRQTRMKHQMGKLDVEGEWQRFCSDQNISGHSSAKTVLFRNVFYTVSSIAAVVLIVFLVSHWGWKQEDQMLAFEANNAPKTIMIGDKDNDMEPINDEQSDNGILLSQNKADFSKVRIVNGKNATKTITTPRGKDYEVVLSDGTEVLLNADSKLIFPVRFSGENRTVRLVGEAYFKVTKNKHCPFIVMTDKVATKVYGTEFNLKAYPHSGVNVTLISGSAAVNSERKEVMLKPGQNAELNSNHEFEVTTVDTECYTQWKDGYFYFDNVPLIEVVRDLGRWYNVNIEIRDNSLMSYRLHFVASRKASVKEFVDNLNVFNYLSVVQKGNRLIIDKKENK